MAIIIPSKNIYQIQNPKVRDNVIERIEVGAVEVSPKNEYNSVVYNTKYISTEGASFVTSASASSTESGYRLVAKDSYNYRAYIGIAKTHIARNYYSGRLVIPKLANNAYILNILSKVDKEGKPNIKYVATTTKKIGTCSTEITLSLNFPVQASPSLGITIPNTPVENVVIDENSGERGVKLPMDENGNVIESVSFTKTFEAIDQDKGEISFSVTAKADFQDVLTNLGKLTVEENEDEFYFDYTVLCGMRIDNLSYFEETSLSAGYKGSYNVLLEGTSQYYEPSYIEITVYGNTIGIDLTDKTIYLNGQTAKKVHSVEGNELMQTSNYWLPTGEKAIERAFGKTLNSYETGKETAVLRCSIADYYTSDGEKAISIDDENGRMSFKEYDIVKPMVYSSSGVDVPMSLDKYGNAKMFKILGVKPYYNGAVWQELHLQESEEKSYRIKVSSTLEIGDYEYRCRFNIKGKGNVYVNEKLYVSINNETDNSITIETEKKEIMDIMFIGSFSKISFDYDAEPNTIYPAPVGKLLSVLDWGYLIETYIGMFSYQDLEDTWFSIPPQIKTISKETFKFVVASSLTIPKTISKIDDYAFYYSRINKITFLHGENDTIVLPTAGSGTGMFYDKNARDMDIYTDNLTIKNYDWTKDNITATILHLDGTEWTE